MKNKTFSVILLLTVLTVLFTLSSCNQPVPASRSLSAAAMSAQVAPPTPPVEGKSEIGSTDGILIMGVVITAIAILPLMIYRKKK